MVGAYAVAIIAEIPDPTILKLFRKSKSPIATPMTPLDKRVIISKNEKSTRTNASDLAKIRIRRRECLFFF